MQFPFPSNGKPHRKHIRNHDGSRRLVRFPFPSNRKPHRKSTWFCVLRKARKRMRFHSLQTGNLIESRRCVGESVAGYRGVSIPFKRETSSKVYMPHNYPKSHWKFQFPSNGKPHRKIIDKHRRGEALTAVSIPFKRETS